LKKKIDGEGDFVESIEKNSRNTYRRKTQPSNASEHYKFGKKNTGGGAQLGLRQALRERKKKRSKKECPEEKGEAGKRKPSTEEKYLRSSA